MKKLCATLFVLCYFAISAVVHGAVVEVGGKSLDCVAKGVLYRCLDGQKKIIVVESELGFIAISKNQGSAPTVKEVTKISDQSRVIFDSYSASAELPDSKLNRIRAAKTVSYSLKQSGDEFADELIEDAQKFLQAEEPISSNLKLVLGDGRETYQCTQGKAEADQTQNGCGYYACSGKDPSEKILAYLPTSDSYVSPNVLVMKNGQAKLINGEFKTYDNGTLPVMNIGKKNEADGQFANREMIRAGIDPNLMIPSKYNSSRSSYAYLNNLYQYGALDSELDSCQGDKVKTLLAEQKKIVDEMKAHLAEADIIEYLKLVNGNIQSFYVDRSKGMDLGCIYQNKVVDESVLTDFDYLKKISTTKAPKKYLSVNEVQDLFNKAKNMKDIPFGYKYDGCYARAHVMSRRFEEMGIAAQKVWIKGDLYVPGTDIRWNYHVAPVIDVKEKNGKIEKYVIDPSLTDKAVPVDEWVAAMGKKTKGPIMKTTYPFPNNAVDFQRTVVAISTADSYGPVDMKESSEEEKMQVSLNVLNEFTQVLAASRGQQ